MKTKRLPINRKAELQQQLSGSPFERVAVDLMGPFEKTENGNGCPMILHSDRGGEFNAEIVHRLCDLLRVKKTFTSPYRPESDGMVERSNRTLQGMLTAFVRKTRDN